MPFFPLKEITIDEQFVSFRNQCSFLQYIPSKPGKCGIQICWLVDFKNSYLVAGVVQLGTQSKEQISVKVAA